jgi:glycosyltransferase involved in cell wall biosynthesis
MKMVSVGIDASNLRAGGGVTHLTEILRHLEPADASVERVTVWGGAQTLAQLPARTWLTLAHEPALDGALPRRIWWQRSRLPKLAATCDVLFAPAASGRIRFHPYVTMCRNMLPFDRKEMWRYAFSRIFFRLALLRVGQSAAFRDADAVIFLNDYARRVVAGETGERGEYTVIPHGVSEAFRAVPRKQEPAGGRPFRFLYTSIIDLYKHQWEVAEAVLRLRGEGWNVAVDFAGPAYPPAMRKVQAVLARHPNARDAVTFLGPVSHRDMPPLYARADAFVFASTCENMPNILIEAMAAGLPIACSQSEPMPGILQDGGVYFDAEDAASIAHALRSLLADPALRAAKAARAFALAAAFSWSRCAADTFSLLADVARRHT